MKLIGALLAACCLAAQAPANVFSSYAPIDVTLTAPLADLFAQKAPDAVVTGTISYRDDDGRTVTLDRVTISVRGNTSKQESECSFPKLKLRFEPGEARDASIFRNAAAVKIGTHCGESDDGSLTTKYGRLAQERAAHREAFIYRLLDLLGVTSLRARPAQMTYRDTSKGADHEPITRDALLLEDEREAMTRLHASKTIPMERFRSAQESFTVADSVNLAFAESLIGNFDWCLKFEPDDEYRCDAHKPLWNMAALAREDGTIVPLIYDFDLSGMVTGRHPWFHNIFNAAFDEHHDEAAVEVAAQLQHTRSLFTRDALDAARRRFAAKRADAYRALEEAPVDEAGKRQIRRYLDPFFAAMDRDDAFYLPVVVRSNARVLADPAGARDACPRGGPAPIGTVVSAPLARQGSMVQVTMLDALWHWTGPSKCAAILKGPVWIDGRALGADFPSAR